MGMTIPQYVREVRIEKAAELLLRGRHNVTEAAMEVGYSSLSHFSKAFCTTSAAARPSSPPPRRWWKSSGRRRGFKGSRRTPCGGRRNTDARRASATHGS